MKATELQINDIVNLSETSDIVPCKIVELHYDELLEIQPHDTACDVVGYDMIYPIPLTADLLKKNGCTMTDKGDYGEWHIKENPNIPLWQHTEFIIFGGIQIYFVHELQHALRLCGLNELADNLKVC